MPKELGNPQVASEREGVFILPEDFQHTGEGVEHPNDVKLHPDIASGKYRVTPPEQRPVQEVPMNVREVEQSDVEEMAVVQIDEWLGSDVEVPTEWVPLPRLNKKVQIQALTEQERKDIRAAAPFINQRGQGRKMQRVRDPDWIAREMIRRCIVQPNLRDMDEKMAHQALQKGLAGELFSLTVRINELSGFDLDDLIPGGGNPE